MKNKKQAEIELKKYYNSFIKKNWKIFGKYLNPEFLYFTDNCIVQNKKKFMDFLKKDKWKGTDYAISDLKILNSENENIVIALYKILFKGSIKNIEFNVNAIETTVLTLKNNEWKILHCHSSNKI